MKAGGFAPPFGVTMGLLALATYVFSKTGAPTSTFGLIKPHSSQVLEGDFLHAAIKYAFGVRPKPKAADGERLPNVQR